MQIQLVQKISSGFLYCFVFFLPWQTLYFLREVFIEGEKWEYGTIAIYISDLFLLAFLLSWFGGVFWQKFHLLKVRDLQREGSGVPLNFLGKFTSLIACGIVVYFITGTLWSSDPLLSLYGALKIIFAILLVYAVWRGSWNVRALIGVFCLSMLGHVILGMYQFLSQGSFSSTFLGISQYVASQGGVSVVESVGAHGQGRFLRAYGGFTHPNIFGVVCAVMTILSLGGTWLWRTSRGHRLFFFVASLLFFAGVLVSFSRNGLIVVLFGMLLLSGYAGYQARRKNEPVDRLFFRRLLGGSLAGFGFVFAIFFLAYGDLFITRTQGDARLERLSMTERRDQYTEAFDVIAQQTWNGVGFGTYTRELMIAEDSSRPMWQYQAVHNSYVLALSEIGIVGLSLFGALSLCLLRYMCTRRARLLGSFVGFLFFGSFLMLMLSALFDHWQWGSHFGILLVALFLGLTLSVIKKGDGKM